MVEMNAPTFVSLAGTSPQWSRPGVYKLKAPHLYQRIDGADLYLWKKSSVWICGTASGIGTNGGFCSRNSDDIIGAWNEGNVCIETPKVVAFGICGPAPTHGDGWRRTAIGVYELDESVPERPIYHLLGKKSKRMLWLTTTGWICGKPKDVGSGLGYLSSLRTSLLGPWNENTICAEISALSVALNQTTRSITTRDAIFEAAHNVEYLNLFLSQLIVDMSTAVEVINAALQPVVLQAQDEAAKLAVLHAATVLESELSARYGRYIAVAIQFGSTLVDQLISKRKEMIGRIAAVLAAYK